MDKFEYKTLNASRQDVPNEKEYLTKMGLDGWELCSVILVGGVTIYYWKRKLSLNIQVKKGSIIQFIEKVPRLHEIITLNRDYCVDEVKDGKWYICLDNEYSHWIEPEYCTVVKL